MPPIDVSYSVFDPDAKFWDHQGTFQEAIVVAEAGDEVWITIYGEPKRRLPPAYNRTVVTQHGEELTSAVIREREIANLTEQNPGPLGPDAPMLLIDHHAGRVVFTDVRKHEEVLYG